MNNTNRPHFQELIITDFLLMIMTFILLLQKSYYIILRRLDDSNMPLSNISSIRPGRTETDTICTYIAQSLNVSRLVFCTY